MLNNPRRVQHQTDLGQLKTRNRPGTESELNTARCGGFAFESRGLQQGARLGPLFYCVGTLPLRCVLYVSTWNNYVLRETWCVCVYVDV